MRESGTERFDATIALQHPSTSLVKPVPENLGRHFLAISEPRTAPVLKGKSGCLSDDQWQTPTREIRCFGKKLLVDFEGKLKGHQPRNNPACHSPSKCMLHRVTEPSLSLPTIYIRFQLTSAHATDSGWSIYNEKEPKHAATWQRLKASSYKYSDGSAKATLLNSPKVVAKGEATPGHNLENQHVRLDKPTDTSHEFFTTCAHKHNWGIERR